MKSSIYNNIPTFGTYEDWNFRYNERERVKADMLEKIRIKIEADTTVTISGIDFETFRQIICSASLWNYSEAKKCGVSEYDLGTLEAALEMGADERYPSQREILIQNAHEERKWRCHNRGVLDAISILQDVALTKYNKKYSAWEKLYWKIISPVHNIKLRITMLRYSIKKFLNHMNRS